MDELIAAQAQKLDALKQHKKGLIQQLFPAGGLSRRSENLMPCVTNWGRLHATLSQQAAAGNSHEIQSLH